MSRDKYLSSKEKLPANYLSASDTQRIHPAPSGPANRSVSRDALHLGVRGQRTLCFYNELCQWRLTVPRGGDGNGWLKQHLQVNLGAFACASVCSNEWFTCEITPLPRSSTTSRVAAGAVAGRNTFRNQSLTRVDKWDWNDPGAASCRSNAAPNSLKDWRSVCEKTTCFCFMFFLFFLGQCLCGQCTCHPPGDGRIHGKNCECDDRQCEDISGEVCGGNTNAQRQHF